MIYTFARIRIAGLTALAASFTLTGCSTTQAQFEKNPKAVSTSALCRTYLKGQDPKFLRQIAAELASRGAAFYQCPAIVQQEDQAAVAIAAVALAGAAIAVCASSNCGGGGGYYRPPATYPGNCQYSWQYDAAGNRCGARAASVRPGGW